MRGLFLGVAALSLIAANEPAEQDVKALPELKSLPRPLQLNMPSYERTPAQQRLIDQAQIVQRPSPEECRDRVTKARQLLGKPPLLDRQPASPDKPHMIYAVDRRQDGCSVMVMKGDPDDIRPLPQRMEGPMLIPAESGEE